MAYRIRKQISIHARLRQLTRISILVFLVIAVGFLAASIGVRSKIDQIVEEGLNKAVENSQDTRSFGLLHSRLQVFQDSFYGRDDFFATEGAAIRQEIVRLQGSFNDSHQGDLLKELGAEFDAFLGHAEWINILLAWRTGQDEDIDEILLQLQELLTERIIEETLAGGNVAYYEQLTMLVSGYRESLLEIIIKNSREDRQAFLSARLTDPPPLEEDLQRLSLRLRTLTASEPPIDSFGRHLVGRIAYYSYLMRLYQLEMFRLNERSQHLARLAKEIMAGMEDLDRQASSLAETMRAGVERTIYGTRGVIWSLLLLMAVVTWLVHRNLFRKHIQAPMLLVSERLEDFRKGDFTTPMSLKRQDEWGELERAFNQMIESLQQSVTALRDSEKRYREIFENSTEGILRISPSGRILEINPAAAAMLGFTSVAEAKEVYPAQLYKDPTAREQISKELLENGICLNFITLLRRKDGEYFWGAINTHLIRDDEGVILYTEETMQDISARKAAEDSLHEIRSYLQEIIDSMPSILIGVDTEMRVTLWNRRAEQESSLQAVQARGMFMWEVCALFDPDLYLPRLKEALQKRKPVRLSKVRSRKKTPEGNSRYFDIMIYPLARREGVGAVVHLDDVSERVYIEEMMIRSEKMQTVGNLASGLAHEINNPLAAIMQSAQVMERRLSPEVSKNVAVAQELGTTIEVITSYAQQRGLDKMLQSITEAGRRAAEIVTDMQTFSRYDGTHFTYCSLAELTEEALAMIGRDYDMRHRHNIKRMKIVRHFKEIPQVFCDASQLRQALYNLMKNAAQAAATDDGTPQLVVRIAPHGERQVSLKVEDNGPGMDSETLDRIFDPFYSARQIESKRGMGLSIVYFIVTQTHRGRLDISSEPGAGTCVEILLPIDQHDSDPAALDDVAEDKRNYLVL
ncbi:MAG: hypothetical protein C0622_07630 [Desulfuromonas sp.]|nr:MAG: hypothetical protein C0622_07630 [Desulfuromonas sp.]